MIKTFLKAKHWQLFLLTFGIPMIFQFVMIGTMLRSIGNQTKPDLSLMFDYMKIFPFMMLLFTGVSFGWFWSIAIGLQGKIPENINMKVKKFKIFFSVPVMYLLSILIFIVVVVNGITEIKEDISIGLVGAIMGFIIPLHLFSMFCIFYSMYFAAKTYKTVELQREVVFEDFMAEFFLIWFHPIGFWIIQPKINKMVEE